MGQIEQSNLVTIIGMIAAFITASVTPLLTEWVKNTLQHKNKLHNLRIALYKEMLSNYVVLNIAVESENPLEPRLASLRQSLRVECYEDLLANDVSLFYQMKEALSISTLQGIVAFIKELANSPNSKKEDDFIAWCREYVETFEIYVHDESLQPKVLKSFMSSGYHAKLKLNGEAVLSYREFSSGESKSAEQWHNGNEDE